MNQPAEEKDLLKSKENEPLSSFLKIFHVMPTAEEKLRASIGFMRDSLSQSGTPYFRGFWEVRKLCLPLFKEDIAGPVRSSFWEEYIELTREGRRLKNLLDEESAFATEQIDIAIKALEDEVEKFHSFREETLAKVPSLDEASVPQFLKEGIEKYRLVQKSLNLLNTYATRVNALRKELIKTEMRIRQKNKFFERLSLLGDRVFPYRKELISEISDHFSKDVEHFAYRNFSEEKFNPEKARRNVFYFRDEIKSLQAFAKVLTLNTQTFSSTRQKLSECWDKLKGMEKELKKEFTDQKQKSSENSELVRGKILEIDALFKEEKISLLECLKKFDELVAWMRNVELTRMDVRALKEEIQALCQPLRSQLEQQEAEKKQKESELEQKRKEQIQAFKADMETFKEKLASTEQVLTEEYDHLKSLLQSLPATKGEKQLLERSLKSLKELLEEKKEKALLQLSDDDRALLDQLTQLVNQKKARRQEIKLLLEDYRRILGGSTLDFQKSIEISDLVKQEKERLEKIDESILEIEQKIRSLKSK